MASDLASSRRLVALALAVTLCLPVAAVSARPAASGVAGGQAPRAGTISRRTPNERPRPAQASGVIRPRTTAIQGSAWHADNTPIPGAILRLRNVTTGKIQATTVADQSGRFSFGGMPEGTYVVELVNEAAKLLTVGQVFSLAPGETVATFVRLGANVPWFSGFFGNAAVVVAASAATAGVAALSPGVMTSVSPNR